MRKTGIRLKQFCFILAFRNHPSTEAETKVKHPPSPFSSINLLILPCVIILSLYYYYYCYYYLYYHTVCYNTIRSNIGEKNIQHPTKPWNSRNPVAFIAIPSIMLQTMEVTYWTLLRTSGKVGTILMPAEMPFTINTRTSNQSWLQDNLGD